MYPSCSCEELQRKWCEATFEKITGHLELSIKNNLLVDKMVKNLYPTDAPAPQCVPAKVISDGDCLPGCASSLAYGTTFIHSRWELGLFRNLLSTRITIFRRKIYARPPRWKINQSQISECFRSVFPKIHLRNKIDFRVHSQTVPGGNDPYHKTKRVHAFNCRAIQVKEK